MREISPVHSGWIAPDKPGNEVEVVCPYRLVASSASMIRSAGMNDFHCVNALGTSKPGRWCCVSILSIGILIHVWAVPYSPPPRSWPLCCSRVPNLVCADQQPECADFRQKTTRSTAVLTMPITHWPMLKRLLL